MRQEAPEEEMKKLLYDKTYLNKIKYLYGNPLKYKDLKRCIMEKA
jgi:hypothetical protein